MSPIEQIKAIASVRPDMATARMKVVAAHHDACMESRHAGEVCDRLQTHVGSVRNACAECAIYAQQKLLLQDRPDLAKLAVEMRDA